MDLSKEINPWSDKNSRNLHSISAVIIVILLYIFFLNYFIDLKTPLTIALVLLTLTPAVIMVLRFKTFTLYILSFLVPVSITYSIGKTNVSAPSELICTLLSIFFVIKMLTGYKLPKAFLKHPISIFIMMDIAWMFVTSCTSESPAVSFKRLIIRVIYYIAFYYFYFELFKINKKNIAGIFLLHCLGFLIPIINTTIFHIGLSFNSGSAQLASAPFYNDHTMYGAALVFFIPFLFLNTFNKSKSIKSKFLYGFLLLIFSFAAFFSYSRAAWLSLIIASVFGLILRYRISYKYILALVLTVGLIAINNFQKINSTLTTTKEVSRSDDAGTHFKSISNVNSDASNKERINRWKCAIRMFEAKPVFGFGPGTYQFYYGAFQIKKDMTVISTYNGSKGHAHSEYLNALSETGLMGFLIFTGLVLTACIRSVRLIKRGDKDTSQTALFIFLGLITFFIHAFFNGFIEFDKLAMPVFMSYSAIMFLDIKKKDESRTLIKDANQAAV